MEDFCLFGFYVDPVSPVFPVDQYVVCYLPDQSDVKQCPHWQTLRQGLDFENYDPPRNVQLQLELVNGPPYALFLKRSFYMSILLSSIQHFVNHFFPPFLYNRGCSAVVARSLCMWKAPGSIPGISNIFFLFQKERKRIIEANKNWCLNLFGVQVTFFLSATLVFPRPTFFLGILTII